MCRFVLGAIISFYWSVSCTMQLMSSRATAFQNTQHATVRKDIFCRNIWTGEQVAEWKESYSLEPCGTFIISSANCQML